MPLYIFVLAHLTFVFCYFCPCIYTSAIMNFVQILKVTKNRNKYQKHTMLKTRKVSPRQSINTGRAEAGGRAARRAKEVLGSKRRMYTRQTGIETHIISHKDHASRLKLACCVLSLVTFILLLSSVVLIHTSLTLGKLFQNKLSSYYVIMCRHLLEIRVQLQRVLGIPPRKPTVYVGSRHGLPQYNRIKTTLNFTAAQQRRGTLPKMRSHRKTFHHSFYKCLLILPMSTR